jgi:hypothetical protein
MQTWKSGGGSGSGSGKIIKAENVNTNTVVAIPANYFITNVVIKLVTPSQKGDITQMSIGDNTDYDNYMPMQDSVPSNNAGVTNTILIDQTPVAATNLTINSASWESVLSFYFYLVKYK